MVEEFNTNLYYVGSSYLKLLGVEFTPKHFKRQIEWNPFYPSLYSLSSVFNKYNVESQGAKIEPTDLDRIPIPFIALIRIKETGLEDFVLVSEVDSNYVEYSYERKVRVNRDEFLTLWESRVVFVAERNKDSGEKNFRSNNIEKRRNNLRRLSLILGGCLMFFALSYKFLFTTTNLYSSIILLFSTILGLSVSILLLIHEVDKSNKFVKNICTGGTKTNCNAVLSSAVSKILGITWSEIGFFFFSFILILLLLPYDWDVQRSVYLTYFFLISAIYIPFSIIYQFFIIKQLCRLCLLIQLVFLINLFWTIFYGQFDIVFSLKDVMTLGVSGLAPVLLWYSLKPLFLNAVEKEKYLSRYKRLTSNQEIFRLMLKGNPEAPDGWKELSIVKGKKEASNYILKVCNPYCKHCDSAHSVFNDLLTNNKDLKIYTIYNVSSDEDNYVQKPVRHFLALEELGSHDLLAEVMNYWYLNDNPQYEYLEKHFPVQQELLLAQSEKIEKMRKWCLQAKITYTPTVYLNDVKLPGSFSLKDLKEIF